MEADEKTFRYSYVFKNLGVFYLMFLVSCVVAGWFVGIREFMFFAILIGVGVILLTLFLTFSVNVSNVAIKTRTLFGTKSLQWSEISRISSQGSSLKLHNHDGGGTLSIDPRLDGSAEIFNLIFSKRADLFDAYKNDPISCSHKNNISTLVLGLVFIILSFLLYFYKNYFFVPGVLGLWLCIQSLINLYTNPRTITLENNRLVVNYLKKSISYSADDIASFQMGVSPQKQFVDVFMVLKDKRIMKMPRFKQGYFIFYPVLKQWHEIHTARHSELSA